MMINGDSLYTKVAVSGVILSVISLIWNIVPTGRLLIPNWTDYRFILYLFICVFSLFYDNNKIFKWTHVLLIFSEAVVCTFLNSGLSYIVCALYLIALSICIPYKIITARYTILIPLYLLVILIFDMVCRSTPPFTFIMQSLACGFVMFTFYLSVNRMLEEIKTQRQNAQDTVTDAKELAEICHRLFDKLEAHNNNE